MDIQALRNKEEQVKELLKAQFETEIRSDIGVSSYIIFRDGTLVGAYKHRDMMNFLRSNGVLTDKDVERFDITVFTDAFGCVSCYGFTKEDSSIELPKESLTSDQESTLADWIDADAEKSKQLTVDFVHYPQTAITYNYDELFKSKEWPSDYIIQKIKEGYIQDKLMEDINIQPYNREKNKHIMNFGAPDTDIDCYLLSDDCAREIFSQLDKIEFANEWEKLQVESMSLEELALLQWLYFGDGCTHPAYASTMKGTLNAPGIHLKVNDYVNKWVKDLIVKYPHEEVNIKQAVNEPEHEPEPETASDVSDREYDRAVREELRKDNLQELITQLQAKKVDIKSFWNICDDSQHLEGLTDEELEEYNKAREELHNIQSKVSVTGFYKGEADPGSYLVWDIPTEKAIELGLRLRQEDIIHTQISEKYNTILSIRYKNAQNHDFKKFDEDHETSSLVLVDNKPDNLFKDRGCTGWSSDGFFYSFDLYKEYSSAQDKEKFHKLELDEDITPTVLSISEINPKYAYGLDEDDLREFIGEHFEEPYWAVRVFKDSFHNIDFDEQYVVEDVDFNVAYGVFESDDFHNYYPGHNITVCLDFLPKLGGFLSLTNKHGLMARNINREAVHEDIQVSEPEDSGVVPDEAKDKVLKYISRFLPADDIEYIRDNDMDKVWAFAMDSDDNSNASYSYPYGLYADDKCICALAEDEVFDIKDIVDEYTHKTNEDLNIGTIDVPFDDKYYYDDSDYNLEEVIDLVNTRGDEEVWTVCAYLVDDQNRIDRTVLITPLTTFEKAYESFCSYKMKNREIAISLDYNGVWKDTILWRDTLTESHAAQLETFDVVEDVNVSTVDVPKYDDKYEIKDSNPITLYRTGLEDVLGYGDRKYITFGGDISSEPRTAAINYFCNEPVWFICIRSGKYSILFNGLNEINAKELPDEYKGAHTFDEAYKLFMQYHLKDGESIALTISQYFDSVTGSGWFILERKTNDTPEQRKESESIKEDIKPVAPDNSWTISTEQHNNCKDIHRFIVKYFGEHLANSYIDFSIPWTVIKNDKDDYTLYAGGLDEKTHSQNIGFSIAKVGSGDNGFIAEFKNALRNTIGNSFREDVNVSTPIEYFSKFTEPATIADVEKALSEYEPAAFIISPEGSLERIKDDYARKFADIDGNYEGNHYLTDTDFNYANEDLRQNYVTIVNFVKGDIGARDIFLPDWGHNLTAAQYKTLKELSTISKASTIAIHSVGKTLSLPEYIKMKDDVDANARPGRIIESREEYFKNSMVRNSDGTLKPVYHCSFDDFDTFIIGNEDGTLDFDDWKGESGFAWFSESEQYAQQYGDADFEYECYLNITNPLDLGDINQDIFDENGTEVKIKQRPKGRRYKFTDWWESSDSVKVSDAFINLCKLVDIAPEDMLVYAIKWGETEMIFDLTRRAFFKNLVVKKGYDGVTAIESGYRTWGCVRPNQIKLISNDNPTDKDSMKEDIQPSAPASFVSKEDEDEDGIARYQATYVLSTDMLYVLRSLVDEVYADNAFNKRIVSHYLDKAIKEFESGDDFHGPYSDGNFRLHIAVYPTDIEYRLWFAHCIEHLVSVTREELCYNTPAEDYEFAKAIEQVCNIEPSIIDKYKDSILNNTPLHMTEDIKVEPVDTLKYKKKWLFSEPNTLSGRQSADLIGKYEFDNVWRLSSINRNRSFNYHVIMDNVDLKTAYADFSTLPLGRVSDEEYITSYRIECTPPNSGYSTTVFVRTEGLNEDITITNTDFDYDPKYLNLDPGHDRREDSIQFINDHWNEKIWYLVGHYDKLSDNGMRSFGVEVRGNEQSPNNFTNNKYNGYMTFPEAYNKFMTFDVTDETSNYNKDYGWWVTMCAKGFNYSDGKPLDILFRDELEDADLEEDIQPSKIQPAVYDKKYLMSGTYSGQNSDELIDEYQFEKWWYLDELNYDVESIHNGKYNEFSDNKFNGFMTFEDAYKAFLDYKFPTEQENENYNDYADIRLVLCDMTDENAPEDVDVLMKTRYQETREDLQLVPTEQRAFYDDKYLVTSDFTDKAAAAAFIEEKCEEPHWTVRIISMGGDTLDYADTDLTFVEAYQLFLEIEPDIAEGEDRVVIGYDDYDWNGGIGNASDYICVDLFEKDEGAVTEDISYAPSYTAGNPSDIQFDKKYLPYDLPNFELAAKTTIQYFGGNPWFTVKLISHHFTRGGRVRWKARTLADRATFSDAYKAFTEWEFRDCDERLTLSLDWDIISDNDRAEIDSIGEEVIPMDKREWWPIMGDMLIRRNSPFSRVISQHQHVNEDLNVTAAEPVVKYDTRYAVNDEAYALIDAHHDEPVWNVFVWHYKPSDERSVVLDSLWLGATFEDAYATFKDKIDVDNYTWVDTDEVYLTLEYEDVDAEDESIVLQRKATDLCEDIQAQPLDIHSMIAPYFIEGPTWKDYTLHNYPREVDNKTYTNKELIDTFMGEPYWQIGTHDSTDLGSGEIPYNHLTFEEALDIFLNYQTDSEYTEYVCIDFCNDSLITPVCVKELKHDNPQVNEDITPTEVTSILPDKAINYLLIGEGELSGFSSFDEAIEYINALADEHVWSVPVYNQFGDEEENLGYNLTFKEAYDKFINYQLEPAMGAGFEHGKCNIVIECLPSRMFGYTYKQALDRWYNDEILDDECKKQHPLAEDLQLTKVEPKYHIEFEGDSESFVSSIKIVMDNPEAGEIVKQTYITNRGIKRNDFAYDVTDISIEFDIRSEFTINLEYNDGDNANPDLVYIGKASWGINTPKKFQALDAALKALLTEEDYKKVTESNTFKWAYEDVFESGNNSDINEDITPVAMDISEFSIENVHSMGAMFVKSNVHAHTEEDVVRFIEEHADEPIWNVSRWTTNDINYDGFICDEVPFMEAWNELVFQAEKQDQKDYFELRFKHGPWDTLDAVIILNRTNHDIFLNEDIQPVTLDTNPNEENKELMSKFLSEMCFAGNEDNLYEMDDYLFEEFQNDIECGWHFHDGLIDKVYIPWIGDAEYDDAMSDDLANAIYEGNTEFFRAHEDYIKPYGGNASNMEVEEAIAQEAELWGISQEDIDEFLQNNKN